MATKPRKAITHSPEVTLGVYGSHPHLQSPHIQATLRVLRALRRLTVLELSDSSTSWPHLDCLLVIYSPGLPLERVKALEGVCMVNDIGTLERMLADSGVQLGVQLGNSLALSTDCG